MTSKIRVLIISHRRQAMLDGCLQSLIVAWESTLPNQFEFEINVLFNNDADSFSYFKLRYARLPFIRFSSLEDSHTPGSARNFLLEKAADGWILFLDDDVAVNNDYFLQSLKIIQSNPDIQIFGGPNINFETSSPSEQLQGLVLGSWWGAGPFAARYSQTSPHQTRRTFSLILCQLWIKKEVSDEFMFLPELVCAEENEFFSRTYKARGIDYFYFPQLVVFHHRRSNLKEFFKQATKFGNGRGQWLRMKLNFFIASPILIFMALSGAPLFFIWGAFCGLGRAILQRKLNLFFSTWAYCASLQIGYIFGIVSGFHKHVSPLAKT